MTPSKNAKIEEKHENMLGQREQSNTIRINNITQRDKSECTIAQSAGAAEYTDCTSAEG